MSIIAGLKTYIASFPGLSAGMLLQVDALGSTPIQYSILPHPGKRVLVDYASGGGEYEYPFYIQITMATADELVRIENSEFFEGLSAWFDSQTVAGVLPTLDSGQAALYVEAIEWGTIYEQGNSGTGIYQIACRLVYLESV